MQIRAESDVSMLRRFGAVTRVKFILFDFEMKVKNISNFAEVRRLVDIKMLANASVLGRYGVFATALNFRIYYLENEGQERLRFG